VLPRRKTPAAALLLLVAATLVGCAGARPFEPPESLPDDRRPIPKPAEREINIAGELADNQVIRQVKQMFDLARGARRVTRHPKESMDVDAFDEVANSSWFTNRNHMLPMSVEEFRRGPNRSGGPDMSSTWEVFRAKLQGYTPGFSIVDGKGERYVIKFDPARHPELITGAEVVSTLFFYAAGYYTPENYVVEFDPSILRLGANVKFVDERGKKRAMRLEDVDAILRKVPKLPDGRVRALASKYVEGVPIGPFRYRGTREDDPNDIIPHQHRRELRGLRVLAAWLCHYDTKSGNTLDTYVTDDRGGHVRHYLIDFGSTLGGGAAGPEPRYRGHENDFDPHALLFNTATLGLYVRPYERLRYSTLPSVGLYESALFDPEEYKFQSPNPAFENMTRRDAYWGAKIVTSFTDEQITAAVEEARYSDPAARDYLIRTIIERRDKIGRYYFSRVNPLDHFTLARDDGRWVLSFDDLAVDRGLEDAARTTYRYTLRRDGEVVVKDVEAGARARVALPADVVEGRAGQWECSIETSRSGGDWSKPVHVYFEAATAEDGEGLALVGLHREG